MTTEGGEREREREGNRAVEDKEFSVRIRSFQ